MVMVTNVLVKPWVIVLLVAAMTASLAGMVTVFVLPHSEKSVKKQSKPKVSAHPAQSQLRQLTPLYAFPNGGQEVFPRYRLVALYGTPGSARMGALGEQALPDAITRAKDLGAQYQAYTGEHIWPTFEIIATIASASPTADGNYSRELDIAELQPWVDAAKAAGIYVILDLQPGRTDFLTQAKQYEPLLTEPHVGLALDPEWRLAPNQVHLKQIGSVSVTEVNTVATWLADLVKQHRLPQKVLLLHQFRLSMIASREHLDTSRKELAYVIQMDGNGAQPTKLNTWRTILQQPPAQVQFGWKNFYDEDTPMLSPEATMQLDPRPWYVSYQ
jgi:hypothetical protein